MHFVSGWSRWGQLTYKAHDTHPGAGSSDSRVKLGWEMVQAHKRKKDEDFWRWLRAPGLVLTRPIGRGLLEPQRLVFRVEAYVYQTI